MENQIMAALIKRGDIVHLKPKKNLPNFPKKIRVDFVTDQGLVYGCSETSDGFMYPWWAIEKIVKIGDDDSKRRKEKC